ncbi:MAG TPA: threonine synthase, partial [Spirochaetota bacterium]|nr:threonine synthase [Spirochaetota bacterium]
GVALAVLLKLVEKQVISKTDKTVVISTAHGLKFSEFKVGYHQGTLPDVKSIYANRPIELEANADRVREVLFNELQRRSTVAY